MNPYVFDRRLLAAPIAGRFVREVPGIANDIAKPGVDENADPRMPVPAFQEMARLVRRVRGVLSDVLQLTAVFVSGEDRVIPRSNARRLLARIGSTRVEVVPCPNSYHVATLDHDAPLVRARVLAFAREFGREATDPSRRAAGA